jgi:hypothetical protein
MQDSLCTMLTGGAFSRRERYTDNEESLTDVTRPVIINSITGVVTRPDLTDRFICIELPTISDSQREAVGAMKVRQKLLMGSIFGGLLNHFSAALAELPKIEKEGLPLPRMADFAMLGEAVARTQKKKPGSFLKIFNQHRNGNARETIENDILGAAITSFVAAKSDGVSGTFAEIAGALKEHLASNKQTAFRDKDWPDTGKDFGNRLRRLRPAMLQIGIEIEFGPRKNNGSTYTIKKVRPMSPKLAPT